MNQIIPTPSFICWENAQCVFMAQAKSKPNQVVLLSNGSKDLREVLSWEYVCTQKSILTRRNDETKYRKRWQFNEITVKSSPGDNDSAKQLFSTKRWEMLNFRHYWLSSHLLPTLFSSTHSQIQQNHLFSVHYYYYTYVFDIFFPLVPPWHCNKKPVVPWLKAIPAFSF